MALLLLLLPPLQLVAAGAAAAAAAAPAAVAAACCVVSILKRCSCLTRDFWYDTRYITGVQYKEYLVVSSECQCTVFLVPKVVVLFFRSFSVFISSGPPTHHTFFKK